LLKPIGVWIVALLPLFSHKFLRIAAFNTGVEPTVENGFHQEMASRGSRIDIRDVALLAQDGSDFNKKY